MIEMRSKRLKDSERREQDDDSNEANDPDDWHNVVEQRREKVFPFHFSHNLARDEITPKVAVTLDTTDTLGISKFKMF